MGVVKGLHVGKTFRITFLHSRAITILFWTKNEALSSAAMIKWALVL